MQHEPMRRALGPFTEAQRDSTLSGVVLHRTATYYAG